MSGVTEVTFAPLKKDINITDPGSDAYKTLTEKSLRLIKLWKGCQRIYWGVGVENPDQLWLFIDWESVEIHNVAKQDPANLLAVIPIGSVCSGPHSEYHARFHPYPPSVLTDAPVTAVMTIYFPPDYSLEDQVAHDSGMQQFFKACHAHADGFLSASGGWVDEEREIDGGEVAKVYVALSGWKSIDHHEAFHKALAFKELRDKIAHAKDLKKLDVVHVKVAEFKRECSKGN